MTDAQVIAALSESQVFALTLWAETRGEPIEGRVAVGHVIRHRVERPGFGAGYRGVCLKPWQFSCWRKEGGAANYAALMDIARRVLDGERPTLILRESFWIADGIIGNVLRDNTRGADHYYAPKAMVPRDRVPDWAQGKTPSAVIGAHRFYRLR